MPNSNSTNNAKNSSSDSKTNGSSKVGEEASAQLRANRHAALAVGALRALCGYARAGGGAAGAAYTAHALAAEAHGGLTASSVGAQAGGGVPTTANEELRGLMARLLPGALGGVLADASASPEALLRGLHSSARTPYLLWNSSARGELRDVVKACARAHWRGASPGEPGSPLSLCAAFKYSHLEGEIFLGGVYVRVFAEQPDFNVSSPRQFARALLNFIVDEGTVRTPDDSALVVSAAREPTPSPPVMPAASAAAVYIIIINNK
ncbi:hypothetical protein T492DRAFT_505549 [Pavlovales sp. CCMP2436]|nr:hypothetical protein T492DRAFT_505549 [Pavlovales sp. CCMP2436]